MFATAIVIAAVAAALLLGAFWGLRWPLPRQLEGNLIALAGGALIEAVMLELIEPSVRDSSVWLVMAALAVGAVTFAALDYWIDEVWGGDSGGGLLVAVTMDGVPENLALGVALIGAGLPEVLALTAAIVLSNLPEAAGSAHSMRRRGVSPRNVMLLWAGAALLLSLAALTGRVLLADASPHLLAAIRGFAAGAVVSSLATEVFPKAYREGLHLTGVATVAGLILAYALSTLGAG